MAGEIGKESLQNSVKSSVLVYPFIFSKQKHALLRKATERAFSEALYQGKLEMRVGIVGNGVFL